MRNLTFNIVFTLLILLSFSAFGEETQPRSHGSRGAYGGYGGMGGFGMGGMGGMGGFGMGGMGGMGMMGMLGGMGGGGGGQEQKPNPAVEDQKKKNEEAVKKLSEAGTQAADSIKQMKFEAPQEETPDYSEQLTKDQDTFTNSDLENSMEQKQGDNEPIAKHIDIIKKTAAVVSEQYRVIAEGYANAPKAAVVRNQTVDEAYASVMGSVDKNPLASAMQSNGSASKPENSHASGTHSSTASGRTPSPYNSPFSQAQ